MSILAGCCSVAQSSIYSKQATTTPTGGGGELLTCSGWFSS